MLHTRSAPLRYGVMLFCIVTAFTLALAVPQLRARESFLVFVAAVAISAWFGGRGPGLVSCLVAAFLTNFFIYEPPGTFTLTSEAIIPAIVFLLVAITISSLTSKLTLAEEETRKQQQWLEVILSSIGDAVVAIDSNGNVNYINSAATKLIGSSFAKTVGRDLDEVIQLDTSRAPEQSIARLSQVVRHHKIQQLQFAIVSKAGPVPAEITIAPINDECDINVGAVLVIRDITERESARAKIVAYQEDLRTLSAELSLAEERERRQISTALHDRTVQSLAFSNMKLGALRENTADSKMIEGIDQVSQIIKQIMTEVRSLTFELSPPILYEFGLEAALEWLCQHFEKNHHIHCLFQESGGDATIKQDVRIALFQSVRELLTNAVKHADAKQLSVSIQREESKITLRVEDNGKGFDYNSAGASKSPTQGFGLFSLRERIRHMGGTLLLNSALGKGTSVVLSVPLSA